jgi:ribosome recycling factor
MHDLRDLKREGEVGEDEEKRAETELQKLTDQRIAEDGRVAVRNVRRDIMHDLRELKKDGDVGGDDEHRAEEALQKLTDERVHEIDELLKHKEQEILEV